MKFDELYQFLIEHYENNVYAMVVSTQNKSNPEEVKIMYYVGNIYDLDDEWNVIRNNLGLNREDIKGIHWIGIANKGVTSGKLLPSNYKPADVKKLMH